MGKIISAKSMPRIDKDGDIEYDKLPPTTSKPKLIHGYINELNGRPIIKNFSHVLRWLYDNFMTKKEIQESIAGDTPSGPTEDEIRQMIAEEVARQLAEKKVTTEMVDKVDTVAAAATAAANAPDAATLPPPSPSEIPEGLSLAGLYKEVEAIRKAFAPKSEESEPETT